ncbi:MarR family winged helix-turn-helix transcriptional regulator [Mucilaginibacter sp. BJC16-A38]|uniref:MarR family winged helix-turn-helix transcriptional regulator n=1 Tax=Mucilaginibacter phenanthrenivorans TaxID=1234842 RepID=UPI0021585EDC|nr:MarR family winged helix-turn-helix transcriptional regulator [Mucilaginibacter phenanthrenivorans]MCR8558644.1 MarR family winged helix-turn-helix transcriptional regulator [Mucilaginibacter phenanthrenivorans]
MDVKLVEPISRKLNNLGRAYLGMLAKRVEPLGISRYYYALAYIRYYDGQLTQKALAKELGKDKSLIVNIIDTLSEQGFVYREINPVDRREHLLWVTEKAKKAVPEIVEAFEILNKNITADIPEEDMKIFYSVLTKMTENIKPIITIEINDETKS